MNNFMDREYYNRLADAGLHGEELPDSICEEVLTSAQIEILPLLNAAFEVRKKYCGMQVNIHIINNAQNGHCPEDCHYCAQAKTSDANIEEYPLKPDDEIYAEAKKAYESGAFRYCMVFAGRGPSQRRTEHLARLIKEIKSRYPIQICVSAGLLDLDKAQVLKAAGLDRLNHNLNTSESHYPNICTSHTYADRLNTLQAAKTAGIELCSGLIAGMGETEKDVIEVAKTLRRLKSESIPVNFLIPIPGTQLKITSELSPEYCLRILCLYRFLNPTAELRVAAGREMHLRSMEVLALYPANSLFLQGYLNTKGASRGRTLRMIKDAGFTIKSTINLDELLAQENDPAIPASNRSEGESYFPEIKELKDLRPHFQSQLK